MKNILLPIHDDRGRHASHVAMGGYRRSRPIESLLGGVTRTMLRESPVPLFLAH